MCTMRNFIRCKNKQTMENFKGGIELIQMIRTSINWSGRCLDGLPANAAQNASPFLYAQLTSRPMPYRAFLTPSRTMRKALVWVSRTSSGFVQTIQASHLSKSSPAGTADIISPSETIALFHHFGKDIPLIAKTLPHIRILT